MKIFLFFSYGSEDAPITDIHEIPLLLVELYTKTRFPVHGVIFCAYVNSFLFFVYLFWNHIFTGQLHMR